MNKTQIALAASVVTIVVLGSELHARNSELKKLRTHSTKVALWNGVAGKVIKHAWATHPELVRNLPAGIMDDIEFYSIISKEDLA